ncbi:MAG TPA: nuclear transport factor 2 family protein [Actinomycetes bacterium]|jgi:ketosteroid isomerase-like protein|nr:nuclear transport factor 2 family protein [Actinomycetes bacterium]
MPEADRFALIEQFNRAWNEHDLDAALALVTDDCVEG